MITENSENVSAPGKTSDSDREIYVKGGNLNDNERSNRRYAYKNP